MRSTCTCLWSLFKKYFILTIPSIPPTIDISFGTSAAVKATEVSADSDLCYFDPLEPVVTITVN